MTIYKCVVSYGVDRNPHDQNTKKYKEKQRISRRNWAVKNQKE